MYMARVFFFSLKFEMHPCCCIYLAVCPFYCAVVFHCMGASQVLLLTDVWFPRVSSVGLSWAILKVLGRLWRQVPICLAETVLYHEGLNFTHEKKGARLKVSSMWPTCSKCKWTLSSVELFLDPVTRSRVPRGEGSGLANPGKEKSTLF